MAARQNESARTSLRPHARLGRLPHCRKWSAASAVSGNALSRTVALSAADEVDAAAWVRFLGPAAACWPGLASLNNVISESVALCVYVCTLPQSQSQSLPLLTYFSVVQIQVYVREINFDFVSLRFVSFSFRFMPMRGLWRAHTRTRIA